MNNPTEPTAKDATEPASTFSEGNSEGDYEKKPKTKCRTWEKPASCINATCFQRLWSELRGRNGAVCQGDVEGSPPHCGSLDVARVARRPEPSERASVAKRSTRTQCCSECVGVLRAQAQSQERKSTKPSQDEMTEHFLGCFLSTNWLGIVLRGGGILLHPR